MKSRWWLLLAGLLFLGPIPAFSSPAPPPMRESVAVCDPAYPGNCLGNTTTPLTINIWGQDTGTGVPCIIAPAGGSATCAIPTGIVATGDTFIDAAIGTIGMAPPVGADNIAISVAGLMRSPTGVNPSGSVYATQFDLASVAGATVKTGAGTAAGSIRVELPTNGTGTVGLNGGDNVIGHVIVDTAPTTAVTGTFFQATQPISAAALPLPSGAATAVKQPALGTAGSPSTDVITVQGATAGTPLPTVTGGNSYSHIATSTTTLVKSGAGVLHSVCVNNDGTVASAVEVDDALTHTTPVVAIVNSLTYTGCQIYDVSFSTGLSVTTTGAPDVTVSFR